MKINTKINNNKIKIICSSIFIIILILYIDVINYDFVNYDDDTYILNNINIHNGLTLKSIKWAFTNFYVSNWHPVTWLSHMLDIQLFGLKPGWHHFTNLLIHIINTICLFLILYKMTNEIWKCAFVAIIFGIHPLHVESVAWISERKDVLCVLWAFISIIFYVEYIKQKNINYYFFSLFFYVISLMSKAMMVTLPLVLLIFDFWPLMRIEQNNIFSIFFERKQIIIEKIPFFIFSFIVSIITFFAQYQGGAINLNKTLTFIDKINNAFISYIIYVSKTIWPLNLSVLYPHYIENIHIWKIVTCILLFITVFILVIKNYKKHSYLFAGFFIFIITLIPVIGIVQIGYQAFADRYMYFPILGLLIIITWGFTDLLKDYKFKKSVYILTSLLLISIYAFICFFQIKTWKNSETLFENALNISDKHYVIHLNYGQALDNAGKIKQAIFHYKEAYKINDNYKIASNIAHAYCDINDFVNSEKYYKIALKKNYESEYSHNNFALMLAKNKRYQEAVFHFIEAIKFKNDFIEAHNNLADIYKKLGNIEKAKNQLEICLNIDPLDEFANQILGNILLDENNYTKALDCYLKVIQRNSNNEKAYNNIGYIFAKQKNFNKAYEFFKKAVKLNPNYISAKENLEKIEQIFNSSNNKFFSQ